MASDLQQFIDETPLCDTHEHLASEANYLANGPDILQSLFDNYVTADLVVAGANETALRTLLDKDNPDVRARFGGIEQIWHTVRHTGYGEAVTRIAQAVYGIEELSAAAIEAAQPIHAGLVAPGKRLQLLRDQARLDHVQVDDFTRPCVPDASGADFFFYDISWAPFCRGEPDLAQLTSETGVTVHDLASLRAAMAQVFAQNAACAIAIKSQHAYSRTLQWQERSDAEATQALQIYLTTPDAMTTADRLCLGDWCWARGVELGIAYDLPFKLHTGYYAGHSRMPVDYIRAGNLCSLLARYPTARFVLMHTAYPYSAELIALAKHYPNVYVDLCWAWSIDPYSTTEFVRRYIHTVAANKLFVFGGDTFWPTAAVAYAQQARAGLTRALQAEVDDHWLTERAAIDLARRFMHENQYACFRVVEKRAAIVVGQAR